MNVLYLGPTLPEYTNVIKSLLPPDFRFWTVRHDSPQVREQLREAHFLVSFVPITEHMMQAAPQLKLIQSITAGYDKIDVDAAARAGIPVATTSGANAVSVAEHIFAMILALSHQIVYAHTTVKAGGWPQLELYKGRCFQLPGKTIGLVGFGHIGQAAARLARAFRMEVLYYRRNRLSPQEESSLEARYATLPALMQQADIVSIQLPRTPQTTGLIGPKELGLMKQSALLINTARGGIVDEAALIECLSHKRIAGAGLDVFDEEPISPDNPLLRLENVILTPHTAGAAWEAVRRTLEMSVENILRVASGEAPHNLVTPAADEAQTGTR